MRVGSAKAGWLGMQRWGLLRLDIFAAPRTKVAPHLTIGLLGEREALFHLRKLGYLVVARRWKTVRLRGDVDLIAWDGDCLCFIEVKTRGERDPMEPAESAVDGEKQRMLRLMGRAYLRGFSRESRKKIQTRFDVVSVYLSTGTSPTLPEFEVRKGAFAWD